MKKIITISAYEALIRKKLNKQQSSGNKPPELYPNENLTIKE